MTNHEYTDKNATRVITKSDVNKMAWRSLWLQSSFNYERMQAGGVLFSLLPALRKIHKNKEDLKTSMKLHLEFFNTHPVLVTFILGLVLSMEEAKEKVETIRAIKISMMGPGGGIGDAIFWLTLLSILGGIGSAMALQSQSISGALFFIIAFNILHFGLRFFLAHYGYSVGVKALATIKVKTQQIAHAATILGVVVVGAMIPSFVNFKLPFVFNAGKAANVDVQKIIDSVMLGLLPLLLTLGIYWGIRRKLKPLWAIVIVLVLGIAIAYIDKAIKG